MGVVALGGFIVLGLLTTGVERPPVDLPPPTNVEVPPTTEVSKPPVAEPPQTSPPDKPKPNTPTPQPPEDGYQVPKVNKNPPPAKQPDTYEQAKRLLTNNAMYQVRLPDAVRCEGTALPMDRKLSKAEAQKALDNMTACLMRAWHKPVEDAGLQLYRPSVTIYSGQITTKCGKSSSYNAFFCGADQQIYFASDLGVMISKVAGQDERYFEAIMAHEFGHLIQFRSGMSVSAHAFAQKATSKSAANEWIRRLEGNADCAAGLYLRSVSASEGIDSAKMSKLSKLFHGIGDDSLSGERNVDGDHGLSKTRVAWFQLGASTTKYSVCNTFAAPKEKVR